MERRSLHFGPCSGMMSVLVWFEFRQKGARTIDLREGLVGSAVFNTSAWFVVW